VAEERTYDQKGLEAFLRLGCLSSKAQRTGAPETCETPMLGQIPALRSKKAPTGRG